jgi:hypothetical protein
MAIISKNMLFLDDPATPLSDVGSQERHLLFDRLRLLLPLRRHSDIERCSHDSLLRLAESSLPSPGEVGTRDPTAAAHPGRRLGRVPLASFCAPAVPRAEFVFSAEATAAGSLIPVGI